MQQCSEWMEVYGKEGMNVVVKFQGEREHPSSLSYGHSVLELASSGPPTHSQF